jgi:hypothetical protein
MEIDQIKKTIDESSNNVEIDTSNILTNSNWKEIIENSYFTDPVEKKLRETDIIAVNSHIDENDIIKGHKIIFLIECKYIKDKIVLWFKDKKIDKAIGTVLRNYAFSGCCSEKNLHCILDSKQISHHYIEKNKVAKKWDYVKWDYDKNKSTTKDHKDVIGTAINQLTNALYFYSHNEYDTKCSIFPILIINDYKNIYRVEDNGEYSEVKERFQIETEYSIKIDGHGAEHFYQLIDVVSVGELKDFIDYFSSKTLKIIYIKIIGKYN